MVQHHLETFLAQATQTDPMGFGSPAWVERDLRYLDLPHQPPPLSPARGPPQGAFLLDQTSEFDPTETQPVPEFIFDQSLPEEFEG